MSGSGAFKSFSGLLSSSSKAEFALTFFGAYTLEPKYENAASGSFYVAFKIFSTSALAYPESSIKIVTLSSNEISFA